MSESDDSTKKPPKTTTTSQEAPRWAAEEPTAMWDERVLRDKGFDGVSDVKPTVRAPATGPDVGGADAAKVQTIAGPGAKAKAAPGGLSWPVTVVLATVVAVIVYIVVRMIR